MPRILVINPNSNNLVTSKLQTALYKYTSDINITVHCISIDEGPFGIETDADILSAEPLIMNRIGSRIEDYDAFVIACYSDPGLSEARQIFKKPIYGIHETTIKFSAKKKVNFGVIALSEESIDRHAMYVKKLNLERFYIGERALDISVNEAVSDSNTLSKIIASGSKLIKEKAAQIIILGCAGMAKHRVKAEEELGVRIIDPVQISVEIAIENFIR
tara:strand:+ start:589 stop:1239 length:651 start_codon:yes stop_codon:yes gene_type:complete